MPPQTTGGWKVIGAGLPPARTGGCVPQRVEASLATDGSPFETTNKSADATLLRTASGSGRLAPACSQSRNTNPRTHDLRL